ncbi:hypothetical protein K8O93_06755 [Gordonia bronchialis]|uniref:hypothetical protein n=1 Tax=Gordonia bronchialis TaxID=2054 RepID=UPI001CBD81B7|nr:hypothetical protein [Gordonia bronchialis]UAK39374.1 hypothetical protein K8O93_06755 [Gordonia bronchialis]
MKVNPRRTARFYDPSGYSMPVCRTCWRFDGVLRRGRVWVEQRRDGKRLAHRLVTCKAMRPGSRVEQDIAVAYLREPVTVDVNSVA